MSVEYAEGVKSVLADTLGQDVKDLADHRSLSEFDIDDLDIIELAMNLEEEFDIEVPDDDFVVLKDGTVGDVIRYVSEKKQ